MKFGGSSDEDSDGRSLDIRGAHPYGRRGEGEDGHFMLLVRPDGSLAGGTPIPKEIVFVLDTSGSMIDAKIRQARQALLFCLGQLNLHDRFNIIAFSTTVQAFSPRRMLKADPENVGKARDFLGGLEATGGTDIDGALREALTNDFSSGPSAARHIIFLTDGKPSVGVTETAEILRDMEQANGKARARLFVFGVGTGVQTQLLDRLALDHDGSCTYVAPEEDLEVKVGGFYAKVKNPVMTNVTLDFGETAETHSLYPRNLPALFEGPGLLVFGRYKGQGPGSIRLKGWWGQANGKPCCR